MSRSTTSASVVMPMPVPQTPNRDTSNNHTASSPRTAPSTPPRPSKFTEGLPTTTTSTPPPNTLLFSILSAQDAYEQKRLRSHRDSNSSVDSLSSSTSSDKSAKSGNKIDFAGFAPKEGRRSINFGRERRSMDEWTRGEAMGNVLEGGLKKFKGRLRALTGGRNGERDVKPFAGS